MPEKMLQVLYELKTDIRRFETFLTRDWRRLFAPYSAVNPAIPEQDAPPHWRRGNELIDACWYLADPAKTPLDSDWYVGMIYMQDTGEALIVTATAFRDNVFDAFCQWLVGLFRAQLLGYRVNGEWVTPRNDDANLLAGEETVSDEKIAEKLGAVRGWPEAKRKGMRRRDYCEQYSIDESTLTKWRKALKERGYDVPDFT